VRPGGGGGGISRLLEGSGGGKVDGLGWRGFRSSGCRAAMVAHIQGFFTVGGAVRKFFVVSGGGLGLRPVDWSSPAFSEEGIVVVTAVRGVGR